MRLPYARNQVASLGGTTATGRSCGFFLSPAVLPSRPMALPECLLGGGGAVGGRAWEPRGPVDGISPLCGMIRRMHICSSGGSVTRGGDALSLVGSCVSAGCAVVVDCDAWQRVGWRRGVRCHCAGEGGRSRRTRSESLWPHGGGGRRGVTRRVTTLFFGAVDSAISRA